MLAEHLDQLTQNFPDCELSAFVDIATGIVLLTNEKGADLREAADALCAEAALMLGSSGASLLGTGTAPLAIKSDTSHINLFLRSESEADEVLLCHCRKSMALEIFLPAAKACLAQLSEQAKS